ncbi:hypothetical protein CDIK_4035 [Cucumispora dikerogammari]|nr:hypothetical protein CDIK_4035 [Cucumispora dikerogammari]
MNVPRWRTTSISSMPAVVFYHSTSGLPFHSFTGDAALYVDITYPSGRPLHMASIMMCTAVTARVWSDTAPELLLPVQMALLLNLCIFVTDVAQQLACLTLQCSFDLFCRKSPALVLLLHLIHYIS